MDNLVSICFNRDSQCQSGTWCERSVRSRMPENGIFCGPTDIFTFDFQNGVE